MTAAARRWDVFCKVVDNFGDAGVSWRLARVLAQEHGLEVTLWIDELAALARIAPDIRLDARSQRISRVTVRLWADMPPAPEAADVVIEAFGCGLPAAYLAAMAARAAPPRWYVLEYLSAEAWVDAAHGLPSPHPRLALDRRYWFPGFTARTGGLLRERDLFARRDAFRADAAAQKALWALLRVPPRTSAELRLSLFCYPSAPLAALLDAWAESETPIVCLVPEGVATGVLDAWAGGAVPHAGGAPLTRGRLAVHAIPFVAQDDYDRLLWACDVNFVRGEDSIVRAQWAARPFVWQIYPQADAAHLGKLDAFLDRHAAGLDARCAATLRAFTRAWNGAPGAGAIGPAWLEFDAVRPKLESYAMEWAARLGALPELAASLAKAAEIGV